MRAPPPPWQLSIVNDGVMQIKGCVTHYYDLPMKFCFLSDYIIILKGSPD